MYLCGAAVLGTLAFAVERLWPHRTQHRWPISDAFYLLFNLYLFGLLVGPLFPGTSVRTLSWPLAAQVAVAIVIFDLARFGIHRALHAVPWLWRIHRVHHSVRDGEMDSIVGFRFHFLEGFFYKAALYWLARWVGFSPAALLIEALVATAVGFFTHANLDLGRGAWRFVLNSPRMHLWHHATEGPARNFGIVFSAWDWLFGTAHLPEAPPAQLGEELPRGFWRQAWSPFQK